jgi:hypothetical protein
MTDPASMLRQAREHLAKARLIALHQEGRSLEAFRAAKGSDPRLAAAFATDFATGLRRSWLPATQRRRAAVLLQAAELLRSMPDAKSPEGTEAIAWLLVEATLAEERARQLSLATLVLAVLVILGAILLLTLG